MATFPGKYTGKRFYWIVQGRKRPGENPFREGSCVQVVLRGDSLSMYVDRYSLVGKFIEVSEQWDRAIMQEDSGELSVVMVNQLYPLPPKKGVTRNAIDMICDVLTQEEGDEAARGLLTMIKSEPLRAEIEALIEAVSLGRSNKLTKKWLHR